MYVKFCIYVACEKKLWSHKGKYAKMTKSYNYFWVGYFLKFSMLDGDFVCTLPPCMQFRVVKVHQRRKVSSAQKKMTSRQVNELSLLGDIFWIIFLQTFLTMHYVAAQWAGNTQKWLNSGNKIKKVQIVVTGGATCHFFYIAVPSTII